MSRHLTESLSEATKFATEGEAQNAGEYICCTTPALASANVDQAEHGGRWIAVVTRDGDDFDHYVVVS